MAHSAKSSRTFSLGEKVELEVDGIAHGGESVARLDGWVFFLKFAIPGERVIAQITELGKSFHRADAIEIIHPSPDRVAPACREGLISILLAIAQYVKLLVMISL